MRKVFTICMLSLVGMMSVSCGGFLEEYPQDLAYATSANDLSELLVGEGYAASDQVVGVDVQFYGIHLMDDDMEMKALGRFGEGVDPAFYVYKKQPFEFLDAPAEDPVWRGVYKKIGTLNVILTEIEKFKGDPQYSRVKGEALFLRGYWYFWLVNLYALPYQKSTAMTDPGVPVKTTSFVEDKLYSRASIGKVYEQIVSDLQNAVTCLKEVKQASVYRANEAATRVLLSRVYLYMEEWALALAQCDEVMDDGYVLKNLNEEKRDRSFTNALSPETIFTMGLNPMEEYIMKVFSYAPAWPGGPAFVGQSYVVSADLLASYPAGDLRPDFFFVEHADFGVRSVLKLKKGDTRVVSDRFLIRYPEVYLNKSEALAMLGEEKKAIDVLQYFRKSRFRDGVVAAVGKTGGELMKLIRAERRLEFCFEGQRWFDIRRYAVSSKYPESKAIRHHESRWSDAMSSAQYVGYYELPAYSESSDNYVLPIPDYALRFNDGELVDNHRTGIQIK